MSNAINNFKTQISEIIKSQFETTLGRLRSKIFQAADIEDDFDIDLGKFAENTLKKIMDESEEIFDELKKSSIKTPKMKRDPDAPKSSVNSYIMYSRDNRSDIKEENPDMKATDITKKLAEMWRNADEELKKEYKEKSDKDKERYEIELEDYVPKEGFHNPKEKKSRSSKKKKSGPTKPLNSYMFFCKDKRQKLKEQGIKNTEILRELGRQWKELSEKKKKPYIEQSERDKERYKEEMKEYIPDGEDSPKKSKKEKKTGPKLPLGSFMLFRKDKYEEVKSDNPDMKQPDIMKKLGEMWKNLKDKQKKKYTDAAAKLLKEFKQNEDEDVKDEVEDELEEEVEEEVEEELEDELEEEEELDDDEVEIKIPSSGTPRKCMANIVSDEKFIEMKQAEEAEKEAEKKKAKKIDAKKDKKDDKKDDKKKDKKGKVSVVDMDTQLYDEDDEDLI